MLRIADDAALAAAEGNVDHGALPRHPGGQRAHFVERHIGREADAALGRTARDRVLHAIAGEDFDAAIVELDRDVDGDLLGGVRSTLRMPSSSLSRLAASSKRASAASHGFFSFDKDMDSGDVNVATISLRSHYAIVRELNPCWLKTLFA